MNNAFHIDTGESVIFNYWGNVLRICRLMLISLVWERTFWETRNDWSVKADIYENWGLK